MFNMTSFIIEEGGKKIRHITPSKNELSTIQGKISCTEVGCNRIFSLLQNLEFHVTQTHLHKKFTGRLERDCEQRFYCPAEKCIYQYNSHKNVKYFKKQKYVKQHYLKVHADKKIQCDVCDQRFSTTAYLKAHKVSCNKNIICSCGKIFGSIPSLQTHARRLQHEADILYANGKRRKSVCKSSQIPIVSKRNLSTTINKIEIQPKSQCSHITAAIALSELAVARFKNISTVDIGVQTETSHKRRTKRLSSTFTKEFNTITHVRQTAETETQTNLSNLKKDKKTRKMRSISTSSTPLDISNGKNFKLPKTLHSNKLLSVKNNTFNECSNGKFEIKELTSNNLSIQPLSNEYVYNEIPSCSSDWKSKFYSMPYINNADLENPSQSSDIVNNGCSEQPPERNYICTNKVELKDGKLYSYINPIAVEENAQLLEKSNSCFDCIPDHSLSSSSMQTNTEHDVFLTSSLSNICVGFTSSETQTDSCNQWCSSETQTCEDFSDIEQYLCSTIHTQTAESSNNLFPDLNFMDTYTQTGVNDFPNFDHIID